MRYITHSVQHNRADLRSAWGPLARSHDGGAPHATISGTALCSHTIASMVTRRSVDESIASSIVGMCSADAGAVGCVACAVLEVKRALLVRALQSMDDRQAEHARHPRGGGQAPGAPAEECVRHTTPPPPPPRRTSSPSHLAAAGGLRACVPALVGKMIASMTLKCPFFALMQGMLPLRAKIQQACWLGTT